MINCCFFKKPAILILFLSVLFFCKEIESEKKLDPNLRLLLNNQTAATQLDQKITIVFKVNENLTELHRLLLSRNEVNLIANIGHIYTASIPARKIFDLAKMKFVEYIQSSKQFKTTTSDSIKQIPKM